jgi:hypothetical protein
MHHEPHSSPGNNGHGPTRREFLKTSALAAAAAAAGVTGESAGAKEPAAEGIRASGRNNTMPGRIVLYHDIAMEGHLPTINRDRVEEVVLHAIRILTGIDDTAAAFESLFTGVHSGSTFAIKVNCIGPTDTRWEAVRGVVSGLSLMLGGTYNVSQVTIYDPHNLHSHGYDEGQFTFNGNYPLISHSGNCYSGYYVYGSHQLSNYLIDCDYVINIPALKSHGVVSNGITTAFKNHYGSCCPQSLCGNITGMLTVNTDDYIKNKTALVLMDGLRGTYNGGPGEPPQAWNTFPEQSPNTLFFSTDPVTNEYWARDMINSERATHGWGDKECSWVEDASDDPWYLGVSDPEQMDVVYYDPTAVPEPGELLGATFLAPNVPNPFSDGTALRFRLADASRGRLTIVDATGRIVRHLGEQVFPGGYSQVRWDGRDEHGVLVPTGTYFARLEVRGLQRSRRLLVVR